MEPLSPIDAVRLCVRHLRLLSSPLVFILVFVSLWYFAFFRNEIRVQGNDLISWGFLFTFVTIFHAFCATDTLKKVSSEYTMLKSYVLEGNEEGFRAEMHKRISFAMQFLLFMLTLIVQGMAMFFPFDTLLFGALGIGLVAFVLGLFWEVAVNLDDPVNGIWYKGMVPREWLTPRPSTRPACAAS